MSLKVSTKVQTFFYICKEKQFFFVIPMLFSDKKPKTCDFCLYPTLWASGFKVPV